MWSWWKNWGVCAEFTASNDVTFDSCQNFNIDVFSVAIQRRGDGAAHPVVWPVCHAGGNGRLHCAEKGTQMSFPQTPFLRDHVPATLSFLFLPLQWMFLQLNPLWDGPIKQLLADADAWLCKRRTGNRLEMCYSICLLFVWSVEIVSPHRSVWERALFGHGRWFSLLFCFQTRPSPAYHQRFGVGTRPGEGQHFASW